MATINDLPNEILLHIFTYLRWRLKPVSCVCRRWDWLVVPRLRLFVRSCDDVDQGGHSILRRSNRQYERLMFSISGKTDEAQAAHVRTALWVLREFPYVREVYCSFDDSNLMRILMFLDGLGPNVQRLTLFLSQFARFSGELKPFEAPSDTVSTPNMQKVLFVNMNGPPSKLIYNWFQRNAPNVDELEFHNCDQAEFMITHYSGQLKRLKIEHFFSQANYNHLKCPKLVHFIFEIEIGTAGEKPIQLDAFLQNAPRIRHFELRTSPPCHAAVRAASQLSNLQVLTLCSGIETISFEEHDKFATLKTCTLNCKMNDVPQLPVARKLTILKPTSDRFYARLIFRAPNLTHLVVEKDIFLNSESIVSICTGLRQLTDLRLKIHPKAQLALKAFRSIHLLKKLQHFYISLEDITQQRWLGCWFKKLYAPSVSIECEYCFATLLLKDFKLLLANRRTRVLRLKRINVAEWHRTGSVRRETAQMRPDLQLLYLDPVQRMWF